MAAALLGLGMGAELLVRGAVVVATVLGMSERVIGLTIVAAGTSLPELVSTLAAVLKGRHEMAIANIVGSNVFNLLIILGATGLVRPVPIASQLVFPDMTVMMGFAVLLFPLVLWDRRLVRRAQARAASRTHRGHRREGGHRHPRGGSRVPDAPAAAS